MIDKEETMSAGKKVKIIIAAHKKYRMPSDNVYLPVQVGAFGKESIGYQRDDEGDNISSLNPYFCELTGLYWAWKNLHDVDYLGLVHYRRYFSLHPHKKDVFDSVLKESELEEYLQPKRVIVPRKRRYYIETLYSHYAHTHFEQHLDETRKIIEEKYPDYVDSFDLVMKQRWGYMFNMMIMNKDLLNSYCTWIFDILFELRNRLGEKGLSPFHSRYYGRVSEIIFNVWVQKQLNEGVVSDIYEMPVVYMEKVNWLNKGIAFLKAKFMGKKYNESF